MNKKAWGYVSILAILFAVTMPAAIAGHSSLSGSTLPGSPPAQSTPDDQAWPIQPGAEDGPGALFFPGQPLDPLEVAWNGLDVREQRLFTQLSRVFGVFADYHPQIWREGRYRLDQTPLLFVYRDAQNQHPFAFLINHPDPQALNTTLLPLDERLGLPPVYQLTDDPLLESLDTRLFFDFGYDVAGHSTFVMFYRDASIDAFQSADYWDFSYFLAHEVFHRYQLITAKWQIPPDSIQDTTQYPLTAQNLSLALLEDRILAAGMTANTPDEKARALQQFLAVRQERIRQDDLIRRLENNQEVAEGTARYIEYRLLDLMAEDSEILQPPLVSLAQSSEPIQMGYPMTIEELRDSFAWGRPYTSGAVLGLLLDSVGISWHERVENGETFVDILLREFPLEDDAPEDMLRSAQAEYDYASILESVTAYLEKLQQTE